MQRPERPADLPEPSELWVRAATMAAVEAAIPYDFSASFSVHSNGVTHDDSGGNEWTLALIEGGRAVLYGCDHEASETRFREPPLDLLADAPHWLPLKRLQYLQDGHELGFVYWYDAEWRRVEYPADVRDDGLASTVGRTVDLQALVFTVADVVFGYKLGESVDADDEETDLALDETIERAQGGALEGMVRRAREQALSAEDFAWFSDRWNLDTTAALQLAHGAGLTPGSTFPQVPAETE
ncbi:hypothetical protein ACQPZP_16830 [Spirillospora sp. CA-142024]|uniref:hypothetical protein n=1 Tax=Spirillospora sp. CA-142024 TaxID=3240036 RepID=UPI003D92E67A